MRKYSLLLIALFFMQLIISSPVRSGDHVRVGVYQNTPLTFEENGKTKGFFIDILEYIAGKEGWKIEYVHSSWPECLSNLKSGKIDLLGSIAYSETRGRNFDYTYESVITNWGQMYLNKKSDIESIIDLKGKKVAVLQNDIYFNNLRKLVNQSGIKCRFVEAFEYEDVLELVEIGRCEAGLVSQIYGLQRESDYDIIKSSIFLSPQKIYWAAPKGKNQELLYTLDSYLRKLKNNQQSVYYDALAKWLGIGEKSKFGKWFKWVISSFVVLLVLFLTVSLILRVQVKSKTSELLIKNEELRESEERFHNVYDTAPLAFVVWDMNTRVTDWNKKAEALFGWTRDEVIGNIFFDFLIPEKDRPHVKDVVNILLKGELQSHSINDNLTKDGKIITCEWNNSPLHDNDGNIIGAISLGLDITDRNRVEEALRESEEKYRQIVEFAPVGIYEIDFLNDRLTSANDAMCYFTGYTMEELLSMKASDTLTEKSKQLFVERIMKASSGKNIPDTVEYKIKTKDGKEHWASFNIRYKYENEKLIGASVITHDITERKEAEDELRKSEKKYRNIFENVSDFLYFHDFEGNFIETNLAFKQEYGFSENELTQLNIKDMMPEIYKARFDDYIKEIKKKGKDDGFMSVITKDGRELSVEYRSTLLLDSEGAPIGVQGSGRDITDRIKAEKEREKLETQLQQAHKMEAIGTLAGGIAHDINNILGIILGNTELAMDDIPEWNPARLNLKEVRIASLRAKDVVRQLLSFARKTELEKKPTNIVSIVKESFKLLRASIPTSIEIRQNIAKDVDTILADPTQINQVLINLCTNADHAMPDGGIIEIILNNVELDEANTAQHPDLHLGRYVNLTVTDTGHGIPQEVIDRIFDPYFTTKEVGKGTGMGLAVVHGIVKGHNGTITVESEAGKGTTFSILFPATEKDAVIESEPTEKLPTGNERILIIDDEPSIVNMARQMLERLGYEVVTQMSSIEALELFCSKPDQFDLIITDMTMPSMTGDKLVKEILNIRPDMPTIISTGFSDKIDAEKVKEIGATEYVEKPVDMRSFAIKVRSVLDGKKV